MRLIIGYLSKTKQVILWLRNIELSNAFIGIIKAIGMLMLVVVTSAAVVLDVFYLSVITMRISIFLCEVLSLGSVSAPSISHRGYTSDVSELCAFVPF